MKVLKYLGYTLSFLFFLSLGAAIYMFLRLPSPVEIANKIPTATPKNSVVQNANASADTVTENKTLVPENQSTGSIRENRIANEETVFNEAVGNEIFNYERPLSTACDNLAKAPILPIGKETSFIESFQKILSKDVDDPFLQAFLAPLKKATRYPKMRAFFEEVTAYKTEHKEAGLLNKGYFYYKAAEAVREIRAQKSELNLASDRAYRMYSLAKAIQKRPELAQDGSVKDFCYQLQSSIENTATSDPQAENAEFLKFLSYAGLDSKEVGYDPQLRTNFNIELKDGSLQMGLGWMGQEMSR